MKFHPPSFLLGVATAATFMATRDRLRPVAVEVAAVGLHLSKLARALIERQREHGEDFIAEVRDRVRIRTHRRVEAPTPPAVTVAAESAARAH